MPRLRRNPVPTRIAAVPRRRQSRRRASHGQAPPAGLRRCLILVLSAALGPPWRPLPTHRTELRSAELRELSCAAAAAAAAAAASGHPSDQEKTRRSATGSFRYRRASWAADLPPWPRRGPFGSSCRPLGTPNTAAIFSHWSSCSLRSDFTQQAQSRKDKGEVEKRGYLRITNTFWRGWELHLSTRAADGSLLSQKARWWIGSW